MAADNVGPMLADGEAIRTEARQHWVALIRFALQPILVLLIAFGCLALGSWLKPTGDGIFADIFRLIDTLFGLFTLGLFVLAIVWLPVQVFRWTRRRYLVTDRRVVHTEGVLRTTTVDAGLNMITDVGFRQGFLGSKLGYADLEVATASNRSLHFREMRDAVEFKQAIMAAQQATVVARADEILQGSGMAPLATTPAAAMAAVGAAETPAVPVWDGDDVPQMAEDDLPPADPAIFGSFAEEEAGGADEETAEAAEEEPIAAEEEPIAAEEEPIAAEEEPIAVAAAVTAAPHGVETAPRPPAEVVAPPVTEHDLPAVESAATVAVVETVSGDVTPDVAPWVTTTVPPTTVEPPSVDVPPGVEPATPVAIVEPGVEPAAPVAIVGPDPAARTSLSEPATGAAAVTETLARLSDLRDSGSISEEDYAVKKQELLDRL